MKILVDNYKKNNYVEMNKYINSYPRKITCELCNSKLEYEESDIKIGAFGCAYIHCPLCGYDKNFIDNSEKELILTRDNIEFPAHFWHTSVETGAVDCCNHEEVKSAIYKAVDYFRKNKDAERWFLATGNLNVCVHRFEGDESYNVVVTNDYYETEIPFEEADY